MTTQTRTVTLHTAPINGGAFNCAPAGEFQLEPERILCNDVRLPGESHPYNLQLWVIGHEFGPIGAVWATCEQDALDTLVDEGLGEALLIEEADADEDSDHLGNAGEPANLDYAWMRTVVFDPARDWELLCKFAEARGACAKTLDDI
jgi:hypothetical protein